MYYTLCALIINTWQALLLLITSQSLYLLFLSKCSCMASIFHFCSFPLLFLFYFLYLSELVLSFYCWSNRISSSLESWRGNSQEKSKANVWEVIKGVLTTLWPSQCHLATPWGSPRPRVGNRCLSEWYLDSNVQKKAKEQYVFLFWTNR